MPTDTASRPGGWMQLVRRRPFRVVALILFATAALLPLVGSTFYLRLAIEAMLLGLLALGVDILLGYAGLLSLGQAAFFGLGAYSSALLLLHVTHSIWLAFVATIALVTVCAAAIGAVVVRLHGVYFALVTLAVAEILRKIVFSTRALGGSDGIMGINPPELPLLVARLRLGDNITFFYVVLAIVIMLCLLTYRIFSTPLGSVMAGIRTNEGRLAYLGYNTFWYKWFAFILAAQLAAVGGFFYPILRGFVSPELFSFETSTKAVIMALMGGLGTIIGPVFGSALLTAMEVALSAFTTHYLMILGVFFVLFVIYRPQGVFGGLLDRSTAFERGRAR